MKTQCRIQVFQFGPRFPGLTCELCPSKDSFALKPLQLQTALKGFIQASAYVSLLIAPPSPKQVARGPSERMESCLEVSL